ncbi:YbbR-like domain-containing protein [Aerococcus kribbianus]|uniref:CdaR family protein n=1 Tax=Aerococcus kribbianus TaxID=2999064 RepID=A0A9X3FN54_9LACT|nr:MULTISPECIES: CdaR family protein [unclassified Aerococcus]MCZ0717555.1 CdaR family protein [Aerococcus sp. YH-aer221]MCZ0725843.1 CdaR family protein [Aerococcus sp. YH-aer222]
MNKFYDNKIVMAVLSLILALVLFVFVKTERSNQSPLQLFQNVSELSTETVSNVPVHIEGDVDNYYVTGLPESVTVKLTGPSNVINQTLESQDFKVVTEDLSNLEEGNHYIQLQMRNVSDNISYEISPSSVNITLDPLYTETFPVTININNQDAVAAGYEVIQSSAEPAEVTVSGSQATIEQIAHVYANVSLPDNISENYSQTSTIIVEDEDGNILNANTNPSEVQSTVEIGEAGYEVPVKINLSNQSDDFTYNVENLGSSTVQLIGVSNDTPTVNEVSGTVDVSDVTESTVLTVPLEVPDGVQSINPQSIRVRITPQSNSNNSSNADEESANSNEANSNNTNNDNNNQGATTESGETSAGSPNQNQASNTSSQNSEPANSTTDNPEAQERSEVSEANHPEQDSQSMLPQSFSRLFTRPLRYFQQFLS